jgi:ATP-dependent Zn protease
MTPLARDVNFQALAETFEVSGGDIRNAVLKAAMAAAAEPGTDSSKAIHQRHFEEAIRDVIAAKRVMRQSLLDVTPPVGAFDATMQAGSGLMMRVVAATSVIALLLALAALLVAALR